MKNTLTYARSHNAIACELNSYGTSVVYMQPSFRFYTRSDFQAFIERHSIDQTTPFLFAPWTERLRQLEHAMIQYEQYLDPNVNCLFSPGDDVSPEQMADMVLERLLSGKPITLTRQTAHALPLESIDAWAPFLTQLERVVVKKVLSWQRTSLARPMVLALAVSEEKRTVPAWHPAVSWAGAYRGFVRLPRDVRRLMPLEAEKVARK